MKKFFYVSEASEASAQSQQDCTVTNSDEAFFERLLNNDGVKEERTPKDNGAILITPEIARMILNKPSQNYRKVKEQVVNKYAKEMEEGKWYYCGESIVFDWFGFLINGQHRLWAIIKSGCPQWFNVVTGVDPKVSAIIDSGFKRSVEDYLRKYSKAYEKGATAIVKQVLKFLRGNKSVGQSSTNDRTPNWDVIEEYSNNEQTYNDAAVYGNSISQQSKVLSKKSILKPTEVGAIYFYLTRVKNEPVDLVKMFFSNLVNVDHKTSSIYRTTLTRLVDCKNSERIKAYIDCWNNMCKHCGVQLKHNYDWFLDSDIAPKVIIPKEEVA